ncbi:MAG: hypothetical protein WBD46_15805, partial [Acidobacteriaceae bacterium]
LATVILKDSRVKHTPMPPESFRGRTVAHMPAVAEFDVFSNRRETARPNFFSGVSVGVESGSAKGLARQNKVKSLCFTCWADSSQAA